MSTSDDAYVTDLALRAGRGDKHALTEFIRLTQNDVWRLLAHLAGPQHADDLTQETYLRVLGSLPRFQARSTARTSRRTPCSSPQVTQRPSEPCKHSGRGRLACISRMQ